MKNDLQITFWGGVGTVTGANFLLQSKKTNILVDCGLLQGVNDAQKTNQEPFPYDPKSIDFLFLTHAHMDHIGRVCKLVRDGFGGVIHSTAETRELARLMFDDALKVMMSQDRDSIDGTRTPPLYEEKDVMNALSLWKTIPYHEETQIGEDFKVYLKDAGHILGSSMYEFRWGNEKIVFTGDSGNSPAPLLKDTEKITDATYLVMDSVYGDRNHEPKDERDKKFRQIVISAINRGGALVIPAFSVERTQVILYELNNLIEDGKMPKVPVYLDSPLGSKVTDIYRDTSIDFNNNVQGEIKRGDDIFNFPKLSIIHNYRESLEIEKTPNPKIIIAGSGMSSGGRVVGHEARFLPDPKSTILITGYQAVGTLGRQILNKPREVEINGQMVPINATIEEITGYSSHKDSDHLVAMVSDTTKTLKKAFVVMGEPHSSLNIAQRLHHELGVEAIYPERGKIYPLD